MLHSLLKPLQRLSIHSLLPLYDCGDGEEYDWPKAYPQLLSQHPQDDLTPYGWVGCYKIAYQVSPQLVIKLPRFQQTWCTMVHERSMYRNWRKKIPLARTLFLPNFIQVQERLNIPSIEDFDAMELELIKYKAITVQLDAHVGNIGRRADGTFAMLDW